MLVCCGRVGCLTVGRFVVWRGPVGGAAWAGWQHAPKTGDQQFSPILWRPRFSPIRAILSLCRGRCPGLVPTRVPPGGAYPRPAISNFPRSYGGLTSRPSEQFSAFAEGVAPASSLPACRLAVRTQDRRSAIFPDLMAASPLAHPSNSQPLPRESPRPRPHPDIRKPRPHGRGLSAKLRPAARGGLRRRRP